MRATVDSVIRVAAIYSVNLRDMSRCVQRFNKLRPQARVEIEYLAPGAGRCQRVLNKKKWTSASSHFRKEGRVWR